MFQPTLAVRVRKDVRSGGDNPGSPNRLSGLQLAPESANGPIVLADATEGGKGRPNHVKIIVRVFQCSTTLSTSRAPVQAGGGLVKSSGGANQRTWWRLRCQPPACVSRIQFGRKKEQKYKTPHKRSIRGIGDQFMRSLGADARQRDQLPYAIRRSGAVNEAPGVRPRGPRTLDFPSRPCQNAKVPPYFEKEND